MRSATAALAALLIAGTATAAYALVKGGPNISGPGINARLKAAAPGGPGDSLAFTAFWGLRAYSSAQLTGSTNAVRISRTSDNFEYDVKILPSGELDVAPGSGPALHCNATSCFVSILYDQVGSAACGGSCNLVQATPANRLAFVFNCVGTKPCMQSTSTAISMSPAGSFTPTTGVGTLHYVGSRTGAAGTILINFNGNTGNRLNNPSGASVLLTGGTSGSATQTGGDGAYHVSQGVITNGAASVVYVDGAAGTSASVVGNTVAAAPSFCRANTGVTLQCMEAGLIDNVAIGAAQAAALNVGARSVYALPPVVMVIPAGQRRRER